MLFGFAIIIHNYLYCIMPEISLNIHLGFGYLISIPDKSIAYQLFRKFQKYCSDKCYIHLDKIATDSYELYVLPEISISKIERTIFDSNASGSYSSTLCGGLEAGRMQKEFLKIDSSMRKQIMRVCNTVSTIKLKANTGFWIIHCTNIDTSSNSDDDSRDGVTVPDVARRLKF